MSDTWDGHLDSTGYRLKLATPAETEPPDGVCGPIGLRTHPSGTTRFVRSCMCELFFYTIKSCAQVFCVNTTAGNIHTMLDHET